MESRKSSKKLKILNLDPTYDSKSMDSSDSPDECYQKHRKRSFSSEDDMPNKKIKVIWKIILYITTNLLKRL